MGTIRFKNHFLGSALCVPSDMAGPAQEALCHEPLEHGGLCQLLPFCAPAAPSIQPILDLLHFLCKVTLCLDVSSETSVTVAGRRSNHSREEGLLLKTTGEVVCDVGNPTPRNSFVF